MSFLKQIKSKILNFETIKSALKNISVTVVILFVGLSFINPVNVDAQGLGVFDVLGVECLLPNQITVEGEKCGKDEALITRIIDFLTILAVPLAILVIIWGGYQYFVGGFNGKSNGKAAITAAITGLIVISFAQLFINTVFGEGGVGGIVDESGNFQVAPAIAFIRIIAQAMSQLAGAIAVLVIMWGGYKYFFSGIGGKEDGRKTITNGIIGLLVVFLTFSSFDATTNLFENIAQGENGFNLLAGRFIEPLIDDLIGILFTLATVFATLVLMVGGYKYFFAGAGAKEDGAKSIRNGIIGLTTVYLARFVVDGIKTALGGEAAEGGVVAFSGQPVTDTVKLLVQGLLLPASSAFAVFFIVLAGFYYTTSGGDPKKIEKGQKALKNAIIGFLIILLSASIIAFIRFILGAGISI